MRYELTYAIKNNSDSYRHVIDVIERFGDKATFTVNRVKYKILDAKPQGKNATLLFLGQGIKI